MELAGTLTASLEDYLEAIFHIIVEKKAVRPKDIAQRLNVSNSSVTGALRSLADKQMIHYAPYDVISLTKAGGIAARDVVRRHEVLRDFFSRVLAVEETEADKAACLMEHSIPRVILERFIQFAEFVEVCPRGKDRWMTGFGYHCNQGDRLDHCEECITLTLEEVRQRNRQISAKTLPTLKLGKLKPGQKGIVLSLPFRDKTARRMTEMGVVPGAVIEVERTASPGELIHVKVKGYHLTLSEEEADGVVVESLQSET